jgi:hypothetical protein
MRTLAKIAVVLLFTTSAIAQHDSFTAAALPHVTAPCRDQLPISGASDSSTQRHWYWEDNSFSGLPPTPIEREALFANYNDFSPVNISWSFSGKHRIVPTFEVVGFDVKPGLPPPNPDARYGSITPPRLWNRASHAVMAALRY